MYHLRVINDTTDELKSLNYVVTLHLIPTLTEGHVCSQKDYKPLAFPVRIGGLVILIQTEFFSVENQNSKNMCKKLSANIITQTRQGKGNTADQNNTKKKLVKTKKEMHQITLNEIWSAMNAIDLAQKKGD